LKIEETKEKQKEFEKNSSELLEKLKKISDKREKCENAAKEMSTEMEQVPFMGFINS
jgi:predicted nuclease with TOPRIM domain